MQKKIRVIVFKYLVLCLGLFLYALAFNLFMLPQNFVVGGVSGISIILHEFFALDTSLTVFVLYLVLTIIGFIFCNKERMYSAVASTFLLPMFIKITSFITLDINISPLLSALYCSIIVGIGLGLVYKVGFSTGGSEIIYWILDKYIKKSTGQLMTIVEGIIIIIGAFAFGFEKLMYSLIILFLMSNISDRISIGISETKLLCVISNNIDEIKKYLDTVPLIKKISMMTKDNREVIYLVIRNRDLNIIYDELKEIDKDIFISLRNNYEVEGGKL